MKEEIYHPMCNIRDAEKHFYEINKMVPIIQFDRHRAAIEPDYWQIELGGQIVALRMQIPLTYAWGMSIHKSQGLTLPCAEINLEKVFESGQAYVALSRLQSLEGLKINGKIPGASAWRVNPRVLNFYKEIDPDHQEIDQSELQFPTRKPSSGGVQGKRTGNTFTLSITPELQEYYSQK